MWEVGDIFSRCALSFKSRSSLSDWCKVLSLLRPPLKTFSTNAGENVYTRETRVLQSRIARNHARRIIGTRSSRVFFNTCRSSAYQLFLQRLRETVPIKRGSFFARTFLRRVSKTQRLYDAIPLYVTRSPR